MIPVYKTVFVYLRCISPSAISLIFQTYSWDKRAVIPLWLLCNLCTEYQLKVIHLKKIRAASPRTITAGGVATACRSN